MVSIVNRKEGTEGGVLEDETPEKRGFQELGYDLRSSWIVHHDYIVSICWLAKPSRG